MLEVTLIILNAILISILLFMIFFAYKIYKKFGKNIMGNFQQLNRMNSQLNNQNPMEQLNNLMKMLKK